MENVSRKPKENFEEVLKKKAENVNKIILKISETSEENFWWILKIINYVP